MSMPINTSNSPSFSTTLQEGLNFVSTQVETLTVQAKQTMTKVFEFVKENSIKIFNYCKENKKTVLFGLLAAYIAYTSPLLFLTVVIAGVAIHHFMKDANRNQPRPQNTV